IAVSGIAIIAIAAIAVTVAIPAATRLFVFEAGAEAVGIALLVAVLEHIHGPHPAFVAARSLAPVRGVIAVGIVLAAFVAAALFPIAEAAVIAVLPGLSRVAAVVVIVLILRERKRTERQKQRNRQACHPYLSPHTHLRTGFRFSGIFSFGMRAAYGVMPPRSRENSVVQF